VDDNCGAVGTGPAGEELRKQVAAIKLEYHNAQDQLEAEQNNITLVRALSVLLLPLSIPFLA
jgi:hypothetical protein